MTQLDSWLTMQSIWLVGIVPLALTALTFLLILQYRQRHPRRHPRVPGANGAAPRLPRFRARAAGLILGARDRLLPRGPDRRKATRC
jgi:hypothetical protein